MPTLFLAARVLQRAITTVKPDCHFGEFVHAVGMGVGGSRGVECEPSEVKSWGVV